MLQTRRRRPDVRRPPPGRAAAAAYCLTAIFFPTKRDEQYAATGVEYFVAARHSTHCGHHVVAGVLFHHAFEMLCSSALAKAGWSDDRFTKLHHDLGQYWAEVRKHVPGLNADRWRKVVNQLRAWEEIRFPTGDFRAVMIGVTGSVEVSDWAVGQPPPIEPPQQARYQVRLWELDELFSVIVRQFGLDPQWVREAMGLWEDGVKTYERNNLYPI